MHLYLYTYSYLLIMADSFPLMCNCLLFYCCCCFFSNVYRSNSSASLWAERREEARRRRAAVRRQSLGQPVAPYNTTQFLMEEHQADLDEKDLIQPRQHRRREDSINSV